MFRLVPQLDEVLAGVDIAPGVLALLVERDRQLEDYLNDLGGGGGGSRSATYVIASANSSVAGKAVADAVCDGVADEVEINAAYNLLNGLWGGRIVLLEGDYYPAAAIVGKNPVELWGQGPLATYIDATGVAVAFSFGFAPSCGLYNFYLDGASTTTGIYISGSTQDNFRIRDLVINGCQYGIHGDYHSGAVEVSGTHIEGTPAVTGSGIFLDNCAEWRIHDSEIEAAGHGMRFAGCSELQVHDNRLKSNRGHGLYLDGTVTSMIQDNNLGGSDGGFSYNSTTYDGIYLATGSTDNVIQGNRVRSYEGGAGWGRYGVRLDVGADNNIVSGNDLRTAGTLGTLSDAAAGTLTLGGNAL